MKSNLKNRLLAAAALVTVASASFATGIDTSLVTGALTDAGVAAGVVGMASLVVIVGIKVFKMIRRAL